MKSLYASDDWKSLDPVDRAQLLLVLEGVKPGTIIGVNRLPFQRIAAAQGLEYVPTSREYAVGLVVRTATPTVLAGFYREKIQLPKKATSAEFFRIEGKFLGYPSCCVKEYSRPRTQAEIQAKKRKEHTRSYTFGRELETMIAEQSSYPAVFDYRPPAFTPCSINCNNAIATLESWKETIETNDPEAAKELVKFNRKGKLERQAHKEYWMEIAKEEEPERQAQRRSWLLGEYNAWFEAQLRKQKRMVVR